MNCKEIETMLADYLGGELGDADTAAFEDHLSTCSSCRLQVEEFEETLSALSELRNSDPVKSARADGMQRGDKPVTIYRRITVSILKTAAILAIGVFAGRASVSNSAPQETSISKAVNNNPEQVADVNYKIHPKWIALGKRLQSDSPAFTGMPATLFRSNQ